MSNDKEFFSVLPWKFCKVRNYVSWNKLIAVQTEDSLFITQWNSRQMTIFQLPKQELNDVTLSTLKSASQLCQGVNFLEPVLQVFEWSGKLFLFTLSGFLKVLEFDESTIRVLKDGTACFKTLVFLPPPKKVLGVCPLDRKVVLIATALNGHIFIDIYNVDTLSENTEVVLIDSLPLEKQEHQDGNASAVMCVCNKEVASQLVGVQSHHSIMLVGLNTGSVFWLPFIENAAVVPEARKLYHAGRKVREIVSPKGSSNAFVLLDGGVIIRLTRSKAKDSNAEQVDSIARHLQFDIIALPGYIREFCISPKSSSILCSDGIQCWLRKTTDETRTILLPVKGVTGFLALPDSNICLATTKHNTFYSVNMASDFPSRSDKDKHTIQKCCDLETPYQYICELKEKTNNLIEVEAALKVEDNVLAAISAAARGNILRTSFSGRVLVYNVDIRDPFDENTNSRTDKIYKLFIEVKSNSSIELSANFWSMCISILTRDRGILSKTVSLRSSFVRSFPFSTNVYARLQSKDLASDPKVIVNLIAELPEPDRGRWISIPVFEEDLDLSYFLTVVSDTDRGASQSSAVPIDDQINRLVQKVSNKQQRCSYSINIPQQFHNVSDLMQLLLSKCTHRCEDFLKKIKGGVDEREFSLSFGDAVVTITFNRTVSVLSIMSANTEMVHAVKLWIIRILIKSDSGDSTSDVVSKAKWMRSVLEKEQLKPSVDVTHLHEIHSAVRNNVSAALPM